MSYTTIGQPAPRVEGPAKVTGATQYSADVALPGTLWVAPCAALYRTPVLSVLIPPGRNRCRGSMSS